MNDTEKEEYLAYLASRKSSNKINYYRESLKEVEKIQLNGNKPKLLLHVCCGPCAGWPLEFLHKTFSITLYYNNSNIWPEAEYKRRRDELLRLIKDAGYDDIDVIIPPYDNITYTNNYLSSRKDDPEGWKRCFGCYRVRMKEAFQYASDNHFDYFTTVMTISRQKDSQILNKIGLELQEEFPTVRYFVSDFKKGGGQARRDEIVEEYNLYHQDYCGCVYSYAARHK